MTETQTATRGFVVKCPLCAARGDDTRIGIVDLCDVGEFSCDACDETFGLADVRGFIAAAAEWGRVLAWLESSPVREQ